jgi:hypothetical protein
MFWCCHFKIKIKVYKAKVALHIMGLFDFGKKEERAPILPSGPQLPSLPSFSGNASKRTGLPSIPSTQFGNNLNQEMVKSALDEKGIPLMPEEVSQIGPVFIKVNKFQEAKKDFERIKENVAELQKAFNQFSELRAKEDQEFYEWTQDIESIKQKLSKMDAELFSRI